MKLKPQTQESLVPLSGTNLATLTAHLREPVKGVPYRFLLGVLASMCDALQRGDNMWISVGKTQDGQSFLLTVHTREGKAYVAGKSLVELAGQAQTLLEPSEMV